METKDYSLLRPFDPEAAKRGEAICLAKGLDVEYVAGPDKAATIVCEVEGYFRHSSPASLRMAPLCWVEGRPVYRGDVLWWKPENRKVVAAKHNADGRTDLPILGEDGCVYSDTNLTWTPPKVRREVKLLAYLDADQFFWLREGATPKWPAVRVPSKDDVIEIEEPDEVAK